MNIDAISRVRGSPGPPGGNGLLLSRDKAVPELLIKKERIDNMKKIFALVLVVVMMMALSVPAFAAGITVENAVKGETYDAYKILEYTSSGDAYSYYLNTSDPNYSALKTLLEGCNPAFAFTVSADGTQAFVNNSESLKDKGAEIAAYLYEKLDTLKTIALAKSEGKVANEDGKVNFDELAQGYWFVTSSLGSLCTLQSYDDEQLVVEKNEVIKTPEKEASDTEYQVGDTISYTITYTDVKGTNNELIITDTMSAGLTYKASTLKVKINGTETTEGWSATPTADTDGATLVITVNEATMNTLQEGQTIVITYDVVVNNNASLDGTEKNTVVARTSEQETTPKVVEIESFDLTINKTDGTKALKGAQFELYRDANPSAEVPEGGTAPAALTLRALTDDELEAAEIEKAADTVYYIVDTSVTNTTIDMTNASSAVIYGLDKDSTYYVLETKAPDGYNLKADPTAVENGVASIDVINQAGTVLPSTGGVGTTLFYVIGGILVLGAVVTMVSKKRMEE